MQNVILIAIAVILSFLIGMIMGLTISIKRKSPKRYKPDVLKHFLEAMELVSNKKYDDAIDILVILVKTYPDRLHLLLTLGNFYRQKGLFHKAIDIHRSILAKPNLEKDLQIQALFSLGLDYKHSGIIDRGIDAFKRVLELNRDDVICYRFLKELYEDSNDWEKAFELEIKLLKLDNSREWSIASYLKAQIGKEYLDDGLYQKAINQFKEAIKMDKSCFLPYLYLGDTYTQLEKPEKAEEVFKTTIKINPKLAFLLFDRLENMYTVEASKPSEKLLRIFFEILEQVPDDIPTLLRLSEYYKKHGMFKDAESTYKKVIDLSPNNYIARKSLTHLYFDTNQIDNAYNAYGSILQDETLGEKLFLCVNCLYKSNTLHWRCPYCKTWDTFVQGVMKGFK
jgi:lipopolysaccharide assembly protein B